jgi:NAD(P)-dependent dehydrogenase (short-subunit alcohol dehydrogenase family)
MTEKRTILVVGGSGGLGSAICTAAAGDWARVAVGYRNGHERAEAVVASVGRAAFAVRCDLGDPAGIAAAIALADEPNVPLSAVVFTGGVEIAQPYVSTTTEAQWREVIETELIGFSRIIAASIPVLRRNGGGSITAITSVANYAYPPGDALSSVPKAAIESLCRATAKEEGRYGIRVNAVAPGLIDAGLGARFIKELYSAEVWETQRRRIALQRFGSAAQIAEAATFLASARADYITGQTLVVDGGFSL